MSTRVTRLLAHIQNYQRVLTNEAERLKSLAKAADDRHRQKILKHLRTIRLAARDLEATITAELKTSSSPATQRTPGSEAGMAR